jgi:hypothetical protein
MFYTVLWKEPFGMPICFALEHDRGNSPNRLSSNESGPAAKAKSHIPGDWFAVPMLDRNASRRTTGQEKCPGSRPGHCHQTVGSHGTTVRRVRCGGAVFSRWNSIGLAPEQNQVRCISRMTSTGPEAGCTQIVGTNSYDLVNCPAGVLHVQQRARDWAGHEGRPQRGGPRSGVGPQDQPCGDACGKPQMR